MRHVAAGLIMVAFLASGAGCPPPGGNPDPDPEPGEEGVPDLGPNARFNGDFDIGGFAPANQVILRAMKEYGMIVADNGSDWFVSGAPDARWNDAELNELKSLRGDDFEVILMEGVVVGD